MKNIFRKIRTEWMTEVRSAQIKLQDNAPLEINDSPTLIHRDCAMLHYHMSLEEINERREAIQDDSLTDKERIVAISDALGDEYYLWCQAVISYGLEDVIEDIILEIQRSNKSKFQDGEIVTNEIGKIQKPKSYSPPQLLPILFK